MSQTLDNIAGRYSCRAFTPAMPTQEQLTAIARAAVSAPSAMNKQPWRIIVVTDTALISEMDAEGMRILREAEDQSAYQRFMQRGGTLFYGTPAMVLIASLPGTELDCGIVTENVALAATAQGLGSLICGMMRVPLSGPRGAEFLQRLHVPEGYNFGMAVLLGTPAGEGTPHEPDMNKVDWVK